MCYVGSDTLYCSLPQNSAVSWVAYFPRCYSQLNSEFFEWVLVQLSRNLALRLSHPHYKIQ